MFTIQTNDLKLIAAPTGHVATHRAEPLPSMNAQKLKWGFIYSKILEGSCFDAEQKRIGRMAY